MRIYDQGEANCKRDRIRTKDSGPSKIPPIPKSSIPIKIAANMTKAFRCIPSPSSLASKISRISKVIM